MSLLTLYSNFTTKQANSIGVTGFVQNAPNGTASSH
jgi:acylphosphatase